jgi:tetratricopeptide (TPR) repeat protein
VPEEMRSKTKILINNAKVETIALATTDRNPAPLIIPGMAVDAAMRSGWFNELAWALPLRDPAQDVLLDKFSTQLSQSGFATEDELSSLELTDRVFHGKLRGADFSAAALPLLQGLRQPVIVHIDLSYFQPLYKNEIATPLLDIVYNTLTTLKKMHLQTSAVTFSYGHLDSKIALDVRFLGDIISYLIEDPARLDQPIPVNWQRQRDALYLSNFFKKEEIRELYESQDVEAPNSAWIKFNLYRSAAEHKEGRKALNYLAEAVAIDSLYALEYEELSKMAYEKGRPDEALRMLSLASDAFHNDPFIKFNMAQLARETGNKEQALELLNKLRNLQWSDYYYPDMSQNIADFTEFVQVGGRQPTPETKEPVLE